MIDRRWPRHFIDVETTALDTVNGEIIEICILTEHTRGNVESWCMRVRPGHIKTADPKSLQINGYTCAEWSRAPFWSEITDIVAHKLKYGTIIGHNVEFDIKFIKAALARCGDPKITYRQICTRQLALEHLPPLYSVSMNNLRKWFNISTEGAHRAQKDAEDCRRVFYRLHRSGALSRLYWAIKHRWQTRNAKKPR